MAPRVDEKGVHGVTPIRIMTGLKSLRECPGVVRVILTFAP